jgi:hypothetical protein
MNAVLPNTNAVIQNRDRNKDVSNFSYVKFRCSAPELFVDIAFKHTRKGAAHRPQLPLPAFLSLCYDAIGEVAAKMSGFRKKP